MDIFSGPLIYKYFRCPHRHSVCPCANGKILEAMQQPIKPGEKYLTLTANAWGLNVCAKDESFRPYHPNILRLPDEFQDKEPCCDFEEFRRSAANGKDYRFCETHAVFLHARSKP